jgi:hypothetical protein
MKALSPSQSPDGDSCHHMGLRHKTGVSHHTKYGLHNGSLWRRVSTEYRAHGNDYLSAPSTFLVSPRSKLWTSTWLARENGKRHQAELHFAFEIIEYPGVAG